MLAVAWGQAVILQRHLESDAANLLAPTASEDDDKPPPDDLLQIALQHRDVGVVRVARIFKAVKILRLNKLCRLYSLAHHTGFLLQQTRHPGVVHTATQRRLSNKSYAAAARLSVACMPRLCHAYATHTLRLCHAYITPMPRLCHACITPAVAHTRRAMTPP